MRALSIRQPWAWLIVHGPKDVENRFLPTDFRGRIYIHAGKRYGPDELADALYVRRAMGVWLPDDFASNHPPGLGCIVGEATIVDCVTAYKSPWFEGPFGYVLTDPVAYQTPIPYRDRLDLFKVDDRRIYADTARDSSDRF